jgi:phage baseplate assembly protein gpV
MAPCPAPKLSPIPPHPVALAPEPAVTRPCLELPDGARAELRDGALELRDGEGRLLVRYADGAAEILAPAGDLKLSAPHGRLRLSAALDIELAADRDLLQRAGRHVELAATRGVSCSAGPGGHRQLVIQPDEAALDVARVRIRAESTELGSARVSVVAQHITHTAERLAQNVGRYELVADRLVEKTRHSFRDVAELLHTRVGRARTLVRNTYALWSRRTVLTSSEDTSIDGRKVLLG